MAYKKPPEFYYRSSEEWGNLHGLRPQEARRDPRFKGLYRDVKSYWAKEAQGRRISHAPNGPLARLLVKLGMRDPGDWWNVGDTPKYKQARPRPIRRTHTRIPAHKRLVS